VVYAVADQLGFAEDQVVLDEVAFVGGPSEDFAGPGEKDFDVAVSNISVTPERDENVDFVVYYDEQQVLLAPEDSVVVGATSVGDLSDDTFGTIRLTASLSDGAGTAYVEEVIAPSTEVMEFANFDPEGDLPAVQAAIDDGTIDTLVIDQPSAEFALTGGPEGQAQITGVSIVGTLPRTGEPSGQIGMLFEEGSELTSCVDLAMTALEDDGTIEDLETEYLRDGGTIPALTE
jgi:polar amino acid transport system substrate-binding protein